MTCLRSRLRRVQRMVDDRRQRERSERRLEWLRAGLILCVGVFSLLMGVKLGRAGFPTSTGIDAGFDSSGSNVSVFYAEGVDVQQLRLRFSRGNETAWCVYGQQLENGSYVISGLEWIGRYGKPGTVRYSCWGTSDYLGGVHTHPDRFSPELSQQDVASLFDDDESELSGVVIGRGVGDGVDVGWFSEQRFEEPFDYTEVRKHGVYS